MANLIYKKRDTFSLAGSLEEFLDLILFREINYFDRTNTINFGNNFINYYGDPSLIQPSNEYDFFQLIDERIDLLFETLGNRKLVIVLDDKLPAFYALHKLNQREEIDTLIRENRIEAINKHSYDVCSKFLSFLKIPEVAYNGECFNDKNNLYLVFFHGNNLLNYILPQRLNIDLEIFKSQYNNDSRFDLLQVLIDKCPIAINNTYSYMWWINSCLCRNFLESILYSNIKNNIDFSTIFCIFDDIRFAQNSLYRLETENINAIINSDYVCLKLIEYYPDISEFRGYPYAFQNLHINNKTITSVTLYDDGSLG